MGHRLVRAAFGVVTLVVTACGGNGEKDDGDGASGTTQESQSGGVTPGTGTTGSDESGGITTGDAGGPGSTTGGPEVACELRTTEEECLDASIGVPGEAWECAWESEVLVVAAGASCDSAVLETRCLTLPPGGPGGCQVSPCATTTVLHRSATDNVEVLPGDYCGIIPDGFAYCEWSDEGILVQGPAECTCGCA